MAAGESIAEFQARMRSLQVVRGGRTKPLEKVITRPDAADPAIGENRLDAGKRAKVTISEERDLVYTTSDNRQDANVFGTAACVSGPDQEPK